MNLLSEIRMRGIDRKVWRWLKTSRNMLIENIFRADKI
jgi:hypothetical protein